MFAFYKDWMEFFFLVLMILGLLAAFFVPSAAVSYILVFVSGILAGRLVFGRKHGTAFPFLVIIVGFMIGYLIGIRYGNRVVICILFLLGAVIGYKLFEKKILKDIRF